MTVIATIVNEHGEIDRTVGGSDPSIIALNLGAGETAIYVAPPQPDSWWDAQAGTWQAKPAKPGPAFVWDQQAKQWHDPRTLDQIKAEKWSELKARRDAEECGGFEWDGSRFDSDADSQRRIQGMVQLAQISLAQGLPFSIDWTLFDNTVRTLSAEDGIAVGLAMAEHIGAVFAHGQALRAQLDACTTAEQVAEIHW